MVYFSRLAIEYTKEKVIEMIYVNGKFVVDGDGNTPDIRLQPEDEELKGATRLSELKRTVLAFHGAEHLSDIYVRHKYAIKCRRLMTVGVDACLLMVIAMMLRLIEDLRTTIGYVYLGLFTLGTVFLVVALAGLFSSVEPVLRDRDGITIDLTKAQVWLMDGTPVPLIGNVK